MLEGSAIGREFYWWVFPMRASRSRTCAFERPAKEGAPYEGTAFGRTAYEATTWRHHRSRQESAAKVAQNSCERAAPDTQPSGRVRTALGFLPSCFHSDVHAFAINSV